MGCTNSADEAAKFNKELADLVRKHSSYKELQDKVKIGAAEREKSTGQAVQPNSLLQTFVDPETKLKLLHLVCYGDYLVGNIDAQNAKRIALLKELIENRIFDDINVKDTTTGGNALHFACNRPQPHPKKFVDNNTDIIQTLLAEGVDFNVQDKQGRTPLMYAVDSMFPGSIKELVGRGASVAPVDKNGQTVFHHFVNQFGNRRAHKEIPEDLLISILESLTAVASSEVKDLVARGRSTNAVSGEKLRTQYAQNESGPDYDYMEGEAIRIKPYSDGDAASGSELSALLMAIQQFASEDRNQTDMLKLRAAIVKYLLKNGFTFYDSKGSFYDLTTPLASGNIKGGNASVAANLDKSLYADKYASFLARLHSDDADTLSRGNGLSPFAYGKLLGAGTEFDSKVFADNNERDAIARANPIVASIVLNHFGFFSFLVEQGGFGTLLTRIGSRQLTPMHILFGITYNGETSEPLHKYFVDRAIEFAFQVAAKEKFFENNTTFTFATVLAAEAKNPDAKFTPLDVRTDLKNFTAALLGYSPTGKLSANAEDAPVFPARDSHKMTPFINALCSIRKVAMDYVVPVCAELQAAFFNSKSREGIERVFVGEELAPGTLLKLFKTNPISGAAPILPNTTQLQLQGNNNSSDADLAFLASDDSPAFTALEFAECTNWMLSLTNLSGSKKLEGSLERLVFMRCKDVSNSDLELFAMDTAYAKPVKVIMEGGGKEVKDAVAAATATRQAAASGNVPEMKFVYYADVADAGEQEIAPSRAGAATP